MRYVWDQQRVYFPKANNPVALVRDGLLSRLRRWDQRTAHRPSRYIANSNFVRQRIQNYYGRESDVVAPPVDVDFFTPSPEPVESRTHLLCVAALNAYKKVGLAIDSAAQLQLPLIVVGRGPDHDLLSAKARDLGARVTFRHGIAAEELRELYRTAIAFIQPGIEDFGIAAAESLACGTPVVAAAEGGVLDIVETGTEGILYPPTDQPEGLTDAIRKALQSDFDSAAASSRAQRFSERAFVEQLNRSIQNLSTT